MQKYLAVLGWYAEAGINVLKVVSDEEMLYPGTRHRIFTGVIEPVDDKKFKGETYDDATGYGPAKIEGAFENDKLIFTKTYKDRPRDPIVYKFIRHEGTALYIGSYECQDGRTGHSRVLIIEAPIRFFV
jgi:hypothetical protein